MESRFFDISVIDNTSPGFYALMGPYFGSRAVAKELGGSIWDDAGKVWVVAIKDSRCIGFCAYVVNKTHIQFCSDYVSREVRQRGVYAVLFSERLSLTTGICRAMVTEKSHGTFYRNGFEMVRTKGRYMHMELLR